MAPDIEQMENVTELEKMLEVETVFEERKRIRARLRELRKKTRDVTEQPTTDRERRRRERRQEKISTEDKNNNINEKDKKVTTNNVNNKSTPSTPVDNKPAPTTPVDNKPSITKPKTPVDNKPPLSPNNNSTAIAEEPKKTKTDNEEEKTLVSDDGKTKQTTNIKKTDKDGIQSVTKSTVSKTVDGNTKQQTETTEQVVRHDGPCGFSYAKKSTTISSSSSSSTASKVPESQPLTSRKMSKFDEELARKKKEREEQRAKEAIKWKEEQAARNKRMQEQKIADRKAAEDKQARIREKFGGKVGSGSSPGPPRMMVQNANSIKAKLLEWCKHITRDYPNVKIENFSRSWNNGIAFCAVIHHYFPGAFNFDELNPKERRKNFDLAFQTAESCANIMPLLDTDDMIMMKDKPDWKCVFTYVQSLYRNLNGKPVSPI